MPLHSADVHKLIGAVCDVTNADQVGASWSYIQLHHSVELMKVVNHAHDAADRSAVFAS